MAQVIVRNLEESVKKSLQRRARKRGRSMEEEAREILRNAVKDENAPTKGLGTRLKARFAGIGLAEPFERLPRQKARPAALRSKT